MNSIESLSMGLVCMTELVDEYRNFIPDHPFININKRTLKKKNIPIVKKQRSANTKKNKKQRVGKKIS